MENAESFQDITEMVNRFMLIYGLGMGRQKNIIGWRNIGEIY